MQSAAGTTSKQSCQCSKQPAAVTRTETCRKDKQHLKACLHVAFACASASTFCIESMVDTGNGFQSHSLRVHLRHLQHNVKVDANVDADADANAPCKQSFRTNGRTFEVNKRMWLRITELTAELLLPHIARSFNSGLYFLNYIFAMSVIMSHQRL